MRTIVRTAFFTLEIPPADGTRIRGGLNRTALYRALDSELEPVAGNMK